MSFTKPCEAVGCVFGYHLPGCPYFVVDAFEDVALAVAGEVNTVRPLRESRNDDEAGRAQAVADVETIARVLWLGRWEDLGNWDEGSDEERAYAYELAERILAALDLPGREQALREALARRERAHQAAINDYNAAVAERDAARLEADTWWKRSEAQVDIITELRDEIERLKAAGDEAGRER